MSRKGAPRDGTGKFLPGATANGGANGAAANGAAHAPAAAASTHAAWGLGQPPRPPAPATAPAPAKRDAELGATAVTQTAGPAAAQPPTAGTGPGPGLPHEAQATNDWRRRSVERDNRTLGGVARPFPQGETGLLGQWLNVVRARRIPPQGCTITISRTESVPPGPPYDFYIGGEEVCGEHPDRELYAAIERNRRQPDRQETFLGRIQAMDEHGMPIDYGWGRVNLAPQLAPAALGPWGQGAQGQGWSPAAGAYGGGWGPYGGPAGYPPPYPYGAPGYGPAQYAPGYPYPPPAAAAPAPPPPTTDPIVLEMYKRSEDLKADMFRRMMTQPTPAAAAPTVDQDAMEERFLNRLARYKTLFGSDDKKEDAGGPLVQITPLPGGETIVATKDGIDQNMTGMLTAKSFVKDIVSAIKSSRATSGGAADVVGGAVGRPPRPT